MGLALATGAAIPACAHDDASLFVHGVLAPPVPSAGTCTYNDDPTSPVISSGLVDGALTNTYSPVFLVGNQLVGEGNSATPAPETSRIEITGAIVQVVDPKTNATIENNTVLTSAEIEPASGSSPSYSGVNAAIMDAAAITHFTPTASSTSGSNIALVYITFLGQTLGGESVQSNVYQFPVNVCYGCLVSVPPAAAKGTTPGMGYCSGSSASLSTAVACQLGQDQVTDCQNCNFLAYCRDLD